LDAAARTLATQYDGEAGGFAGSPKFPPSMVLEFLLRYAHRTGSADALAMVDHTCDAMARGGIYDQVGGGFARYSVDRFWQVPHFEKMLYDNALLLRLYLHWWRQTGAPLGERVARETADFCLAELRTADGGFASALDADTVPQSQGGLEAPPAKEGAYYVWTPAQLVEVLGSEDGLWAAELLNVTDAGTFEEGASTLQLLTDPDDPDRWARVRAALRDARGERTYPARDDKIVASWNGLAITALAEAGVLLEEPRYTDAAVRAAELLATVHTGADGTLVRTSRGGRASTNAGVLEDYGCVAEAYLAVLGTTGDAAWLGRAGALLDHALSRFRDEHGPDGAGFFDTASDAEALVLRPRDVADNASPSGTSAVAAALVAYAALTGEGRYHDAAADAVQSCGQVAAEAPRFAGWSLAVAEATAAGPVEIAVVGHDDEARRRLLRAALGSSSPGAAVVAAEPGTAVPLVRGRDLVRGQPAAYVCRDFVCDRPVTDPSVLRV
ncbi:MAG: thioredoxin domain-containing protein, partial [Nocardioidaceae bacterium]